MPDNPAHNCSGNEANQTSYVRNVFFFSFGRLGITVVTNVFFFLLVMSGMLKCLTRVPHLLLPLFLFSLIDCLVLKPEFCVLLFFPKLYCCASDAC